MQKYTFTVEIVSEDDSVNVNSVVGLLAETARGVVGSTYSAVNCDKIAELEIQGLKVWAKRRGGFSLATPKAPKAPKVKAEETESVEA